MSDLSILIHGLISLPDATSYDKQFAFLIKFKLIIQQTLWMQVAPDNHFKYRKRFVFENLEHFTALIWNISKSYQNQGSHRLEKYLNLEAFLETSLKIKSALKITGKSLQSLEKSLNSTIFCGT